MQETCDYQGKKYHKTHDTQDRHVVVTAAVINQSVVNQNKFYKTIKDYYNGSELITQRGRQVIYVKNLKKHSKKEFYYNTSYPVSYLCEHDMYLLLFIIALIKSIYEL